MPLSRTPFGYIVGELHAVSVALTRLEVELRKNLPVLDFVGETKRLVFLGTGLIKRYCVYYVQLENHVTSFFLHLY